MRPYHRLLAGAGTIRRNPHHAPNDHRAHCKDRYAAERRERMSSEVGEIPSEVVVVMAGMRDSDNRERCNEEGGEERGAVGITHDFGGNKQLARQSGSATQKLFGKKRGLKSGQFFQSFLREDNQALQLIL